MKRILVLLMVFMMAPMAMANTESNEIAEPVVSMETIHYETCLDGFLYGAIETTYLNPDGSIDVDTKYVPLLNYIKEGNEYKRIRCE